MIGHRTPRHNDFGFAAAKLDDVVNLPASRLCALLIVLAASVTRNASASNAWTSVWRDAAIIARQRRLAGGGDGRCARALARRPAVYGGVMVD